MAINASEKPLGKVFSTDYQFVIPAFQRAYSWRVEHMLQLVDDLRDASEHPDHPYFLGSLILVGDGDPNNRLFQVIDGQQRLTSLTIIIAILRAMEKDHDLSDNLNALILEEGNRLFGRAAEPRLTLRERDAEFFRDYVQEGNLEGLFDLRDTDLESNAQRNIMQNTKAAYDALSSLTDDERRYFASYLVSNVLMIIVTTNDLAGAHRIFDVMNMRGMPLTPSDVLKAKAISAIDIADRDYYGRRWDNAVDPLGDNVETFFNDLLLGISPKKSHRMILDGFQSKAFDAYLEKNTAVEFINNILVPYATAWNILGQPHAYDLPQEVSEWLVRLDDFPTTEWKSVAIWALVNIGRVGVLGANGSASATNDADTAATSARNDAGANAGPQGGRHSARHSRVPQTITFEEKDQEQLVKVLRALERVTGVDNLGKASSSQRRQRVVQILKDLDHGRKLKKSTGFSVSDEDRKTALARLRGEMQMNDTMKKVLLLRANDVRNGSPVVRPRSVNVVRILPERIGPNSSFVTWPEATRDHWTDRIGNMVLSAANEQQLADVDSFTPRMERITEAPRSRRFPLTAELTSVTGMTPDVLERRQNEIVQLLAEYWRIRFDADDVDLTSVSEETLSRGARRVSQGSRRITIMQVIDAGLLVPGEKLVWKRPRLGQEWYATVTNDGRLELEDGSVHATPTAAARAASGKAAGAALNVWKRVSNGQKLSDVWQTYRLSTLK
ncbi:hypothetical protein CS006_00870 [Bifidobacterium primatium]|uniref:DUF262 domain-containing protein n=2 Tax=Bifidobacterium TaxID=1678 RepID=A0A2M9HAE8_9BIFI|nr:MULTISPECIES: DUF262 domain-containing protein [Bifidobacterium]NEG96529.1 DUF262 domain-containing protein [Bifidobacterium sp. SMB2]NEH10554.1 DUF262 domain-containing protein [Bifidobacterium saimiriisciurei]NEH10663.1 DUF262 domain-containing protein [Bifidobacterium saimiriisciurei]PJM73767.1 hypothetical protein CS006_00870 [Bifidobacterium primatium]